MFQTTFLEARFSNLLPICWVFVIIQSCMTFTDKIVIAKISAKVKHSGKVIQFSYQMKSSVVALFSVNLMYSVNHMSVKVMLHCI